MFGNPNGENLSPGAEHLPAGVRPDDPSVLGDHQNGECVVWVDPLDPPDVTEEEEQQRKTSPTRARSSAAPTRSPCRDTSTTSTTPTERSP
jgi:hypothetical protein